MYAVFLVVALGRLKGLITSGKMKWGEGRKEGEGPQFCIVCTCVTTEIRKWVVF